MLFAALSVVYATERRTPVVVAVEKTAPAVVSIETEMTVVNPIPFWGPDTYKTGGQGSGVIIDDGGDLKRIVNWHHPATYWLYLTVPASLFGNSPTVLRMAHLALWMPAVWALRELVIVRVGGGLGESCCIVVRYNSCRCILWAYGRADGCGL